MPDSIRSADDLVRAAVAGELQAHLPTVDQWFPSMVAGTPWTVHASPTILLLYYRDPSASAALDCPALLRLCEGIRTQIVDFFQIRPVTKLESTMWKCRLTFYLIHAKSPVTFGSLWAPLELMYLLDPDQDPDYPGKFRHELSHAVWGSLYGEAPGLLNEGIASYAEQLSVPGALADTLFSGLRSMDTVPPLREVLRTDQFWQIQGLYRVGATLVHYLVQTWGWDRIRELFRETDYLDSDVGSKLSQACGLSIDEIDLRWRAWVDRKGA